MAGVVAKVNPPVVPVWLRLKLTSVCADSLAGPTLRLVAKVAMLCEPASSFTADGLPAMVKLEIGRASVREIVKVWAVQVLTLGAVRLPLSVPLLSGAAW